MDYSIIKTKVAKSKILLDMASKVVRDNTTIIKEMEEHSKVLQEAQAKAQAEALVIQTTIKDGIERIVNITLQAVFGSRYEFSLIFDIKRERTEARIALFEGGYEINPVHGGSGGCKDVLSFALRIALLLISSTDRVLVLDEVMKGISADLRGKAYDILKTLSTELKIQVIAITHDDLMLDYADRVIEFNNWNVSYLGE